MYVSPFVSEQFQQQTEHLLLEQLHVAEWRRASALRHSATFYIFKLFEVFNLQKSV